MYLRTRVIKITIVITPRTTATPVTRLVINMGENAKLPWVSVEDEDILGCVV